MLEKSDTSCGVRIPTLKRIQCCIFPTGPAGSIRTYRVKRRGLERWLVGYLDAWYSTHHTVSEVPHPRCELSHRPSPEAQIENFQVRTDKPFHSVFPLLVNHVVYGYENGHAQILNVHRPRCRGVRAPHSLQPLGPCVAPLATFGFVCVFCHCQKPMSVRIIPGISTSPPRRNC